MSAWIEQEGRDLKFPAYVWEAPVRIWHWVMALAMVVLWVTGYFIGAPLPSVPGEASDNFLMGYIRFAHFAAGYVFAIAFLGRLYWAFVGNKHAREAFFFPIYLVQPSWWRGFFRVLGHYLFLRRRNDWHHGHNQLAMAAMFGMYVLGSLFMILTGFALYGEGLGMDSWAFRYFSSWVLPLFGYSQAVHTWHHLCAWYLFWFTIVHLYFVIREDVVSGLTVVSSMIGGWRDRKN
jgi:Ni/Fe-hydrogenase 1 B-type cytochrome subunit